MPQHTSRALSVSLFVVVLLLFALYPPLNVPRAPLHDLHTALDGRIPLIPAFAIPYLSFYVFLILTAVVLVVRDRNCFNQYLFALILCMCVAYVCYGFFQTQVIRPLQLPTGSLSGLIRAIY